MPGVKAYGIDVSHHQYPAAVPWAKIAETSSLCIVRASYGTMKDRQTVEHVKRARGAGLAVSLYVFFRPSQPWEAQLDVFRSVAHAADFGPGDVCPALDVEADPLPHMTPVSPAWQEGVRAMLEAFKADHGGALCYITQREFGHFGKPDWLFDLASIWCAHYTAAPKPATPANRPAVLWQHRVGPYDPSGPGGYFAGGSPQIDQNRILGSLPMIRAAFAGEPIDAPGTEEDDADLAELSVKAIALQFPLELTDAELQAARDQFIREQGVDDELSEI